VAVEVNGDGPTFKVGEARPLFEIRVASVDQRFPGNGYYTVTKDGKRFLVVSLPEAPERQQINVILNWTADIKNQPSRSSLQPPFPSAPVVAVGVGGSRTSGESAR
jgi:hypothetical protein